MKRKIFILTILMLFTYNLCLAATKTVDELDDIGVATGDDVMLIVDDPNGTATAKKISKRDLLDIEDKLIVCKTFTSEGINAAIDALGSDGGEVYMPEGTYSLTTQIVIDADNTTLYGSGDSTILELDANITPILCNGKDNFVLRDIKIDGTDQPQDEQPFCFEYLVEITGDSDNPLIDNVHFTRYEEHALGIGQGEDADDYALITNCVFDEDTDDTTTAIFYYGGTNSPPKGTLKVTNCQFKNVDRGICAEDGTVIISNCEFYNLSDLCIMLYESGLTDPWFDIISHCKFVDNDTSEIQLSGGCDIVTNCEFIGSNGYSITIANNSIITGNIFAIPNGITAHIIGINNCIVSNNEFYSEDPNDITYFINLSDDDNNIISVNYFDTDVKTAAVHMDSDDTGNIFYGNTNLTFDGTGTTYGTFSLYSSMIHGGSYNFAEDSSASDAYAITLSPAIKAYHTGLSIYVDANNPNTGACSLNINGLGAKAIKMLTDQDPGNNCIEAGTIFHVIYDGTNFQLQTPCAN